MIILPACVVVSAHGSETGLELTGCLIDRVHRVDQVPRGSGQAVEFPDNNNIAWADLVEHALEFRPLPVETGNLLAEDLLASGFLQRLQLKVQFLILGLDPRVADLHCRTSSPLQKFLHKGYLLRDTFANEILRKIALPVSSQNL
jgi:hypothetical protein